MEAVFHWLSVGLLIAFLVFGIVLLMSITVLLLDWLNRRLKQS